MRAIQRIDFSVKYGYRNRAEQDRLFRAGRSKLRYPRSDHNNTDTDGGPYSLAMDVIPYPWDWAEAVWHDGSLKPSHEARFNAVLDAIQNAADEIGVVVKFGRDWTSFKDWPHVYVVP
jgi:hypothetical protein